MASSAAQEPRTSNGTVVVYPRAGCGDVNGHDEVTRTGIARRLAGLMGFDFAGEYDPSVRHSGPVYFVPSDTLVGVEAKELGIRGDRDLFGGVVPHRFVATKAITHPLVEPDAYAPAGWSRDFERRVHGAVLRGFSAFTFRDACRAGRRLLAHGPVRLKPVRATGGRGQAVVSDMAEMEARLDAMDAAELSGHGLVIEENLTDVTTASIGQICVADLVLSYCGTQRLTPDNTGSTVYGGSELVIVRGGIEALLGLALPEDIRLAAAQARAYETAAIQSYPGLFASRRNYDVARGLDPDGRWRSGVLEQSWRLGGASGAEIAALEAFRADPARHVLRASSIETYGEGEAPPPHATVYFRGTDEQVGYLTKYALVEPYDDT